MDSKKSRSFHFKIVGHRDQPLLELDLSPFVASGAKSADSSATSQLLQLICHASLDVIDEAALRSPQMYQKAVDKFNEWHVSAFVAASRVRFVMLHSHRCDDGIRLFFQEMYEMFIKLLMNPFYEVDSPIRHAPFLEKARFYAKKCLV